MKGKSLGKKKWYHMAKLKTGRSKENQKFSMRLNISTYTKATTAPLIEFKLYAEIKKNHSKTNDRVLQGF